MTLIIKVTGIPFIYAIGVCYNLFGSYILAIIIFTLLTKIVLLPLSLWCQKNSITMVALMPEINRLKAKFYGDNERISEEQAKLYREKRYHPLLSIVPLAIQIIILAGMVEAIHSITDTGASVALGMLPYKEGGVTWLVPLAAGVTAFILGAAQNKINPLQREQSKTEQWMTNGISIAISLSLGFFVALGVALYWMVSNLSSILVQCVCNLIIPAKKYVDYQALKESKKSLADINALGGKVSKEDKHREKADYKRFFSVANKHLVFYSESSGFYKYFKNVIEELLRRSNITIHYVTSDPKDQIFALAKQQPRIRPYYIGEKKLITLMMKMDADIVVMTLTDLDNFHIKRSYVRKDVEYIYMFHYPLSTIMVTAKGAFDHYDTIFCTGPAQVEELWETEEKYNLPHKKLIPAGYCGLEQMQERFAALSLPERERKKILIAPSWQPDNILDSCLDSMLRVLMDAHYEVVVRPHPEYVKRYAARMEEIVNRYIVEGVQFELDFSKNDSLLDSDLVISDWSGAAYEFSFVTLKPVVFIDTPPKITNPDYDKYSVQPLELALRDKIGIRIQPTDIPEQLAPAVERLLTENYTYQESLKTVRDQYVSNFGSCARICCMYIIQSLKNKSTKQ